MGVYKKHNKTYVRTIMVLLGKPPEKTTVVR